MRIPIQVDVYGNGSRGTEATSCQATHALKGIRDLTITFNQRTLTPQSHQCVASIEVEVPHDLLHLLTERLEALSFAHPGIEVVTTLKRISQADFRSIA